MFAISGVSSSAVLGRMFLHCHHNLEIHYLNRFPIANINLNDFASIGQLPLTLS